MNAISMLAVLVVLGSSSNALAQENKAHATTPENVQWGPAHGLGFPGSPASTAI